MLLPSHPPPQEWGLAPGLSDLSSAGLPLVARSQGQPQWASMSSSSASNGERLWYQSFLQFSLWGRILFLTGTTLYPSLGHCYVSRFTFLFDFGLRNGKIAQCYSPLVKNKPKNKFLEFTNYKHLINHSIFPQSSFYNPDVTSQWSN